MASIYTENSAKDPRVKSRTPAYIIIGLSLAIGLVYANSLRVPFLFDDTGAVINNPTVRDLWSLSVFNPPADGSTTTGRPLVNFSFALNYAISGEQVMSYHAFNIVIHILAALLLVGIARRTLASPRIEARFSTAAHLAPFVGLIWALHPIQTETIVCVAQRTESLCSLFYLLCIYTFLRGVEGDSGRRIWLPLSVASALAGMATKEMMVTAPLIVLLYDRTFVAGDFATAWRRRRSYYIALAGTWFMLIWLVALEGGSRGAAAGFGHGISWWNYLLQQCVALTLYLKLTVWPHPLVLDYGTSVARLITDVWWQAVVVVILLSGSVWALWRRPVLGFFGAWFFVILSPSSSFVPLVSQTMAEHRMYLPLAGLVGLVVFQIYYFLGRRGVWVIVSLAAFCGAATIIRNRDYHNIVAIWTDTVANYPRNPRAHNNLAWALQQRGDSNAANREFARAIELSPDYVAAHYSWGVALFDQGRLTEAINQFEVATHLVPSHADAHLNLGNALMQAQRAPEAIIHYEEALQLNPAATDVHYNLGIALMAVGKDAEASIQLQAAVAQNSSLAEAHYCLGRIADRANRSADAEHHYRETLILSPDHGDAHANLGLLLARTERLAPAAEQLLEAVRLKPNSADIQANLGNVFLLQGKPREAVERYEISLRLRPGDARTIENLQVARDALR